MPSLLYIVHSHRLNEHAEPGTEYKPRLDRVAEAVQRDVGLIILTGGKETPGIDRTQASGGKEYLIRQGIDPNIIHIERDPHGSLETAGETIFALKDYEKLILGASDIVPISSDYHEGRIRAIYDLVLGARLTDKQLLFLGVPRELHGNYTRTAEQEEASTRAFRSTFAGVPVGNLDALLERLWRSHSVYKNHPSNPYKK